MEGSDAQKARALVEFRRFGNISAACRAATIGRTSWYRWLTEDLAFASLVEEAREEAADALEEAAAERATQKKEPSDLLLIFLLKALRPGKYRENMKIGLVSPIVREKVRQTVLLVRREFEASMAEPFLAKLNEVWK